MIASRYDEQTNHQSDLLRVRSHDDAGQWERPSLGLHHEELPEEALMFFLIPEWVMWILAGIAWVALVALGMKSMIGNRKAPRE